ncbi:MAG TPA: ATP-binding protein [Anaerolineales bacterium]
MMNPDPEIRRKTRHDRPSRHNGPPPWWPPEEAWPPRRRWHGRRHRLFPRVMLRVFTGLFLVLLGCGTSLLLLQTLATDITTITYLLLAGVGLLFVGGILSVIRSGRWLRGLVAPIDDLLDTTDRLAAGDYQARASLQGLPELRRLAASINSMAQQLDRSAAQRRGFFANVTHELRTPLTILQGELEGMIDGVTPLSPERFQSLLEETRHLSQLVEDLRTLSLAEAGALELRREPTDLADFVHEVAASLRNEAERAGVALQVTAEDGAPTTEIDPLRLREVLANLMVNGLRACQPGGQLKIGYAHEMGGHILTVADNGRGIPPDDLPAVFDRFSKGTESDGSGLGLAIAKELVEAHGGTIGLDSQPGVGTVATITLPI